MINDDIKIRAALQRIDLMKPGALAALHEIQARPEATGEEYEALAKTYPLSFGNAPASEDEAAGAMAVLLKKYDDKAVRVALRTGADITYDDPDRIDTGNLTLNWILGGGFPRGYIGQIKGEESRGKTFVCLKTVSEVLLRGGRALWVAAERFSKPWARQLGVTIPYSLEEMDEDPRVTPEIRARMVAYNEVYADMGSRITVATGEAGNDSLQMVADAVALNVFDLIVVDSLAVMRNSAALEKHTTGDREVGGESLMIGDFCSRVEAAFNHVEKNNGKNLATGSKCLNCGQVFDKETKKAHKSCNGKPKWEEAVVLGAKVRSAVVVINQIRTQGIGTGMTWKDTPGGHGLKHAKGYDLELYRSMDLTTTVDGVQVPFGRRVLVGTTKSKVCPPLREGLLEFWFHTVEGFSRAGSYSVITELAGGAFGSGETQKNIGGMAEMAGLITKSGAWVYLGDKSFNGIKAFSTFLTLPENFAVLTAMRAEVQEWIKKAGRF